MARKSRICFLVTNDIVNDPRVQKQAAGAAALGFDANAIGFHSTRVGKKTPAHELKDNYKIFRVTYEPLKILLGQKDALEIVRFIFFRLLLTWFWFMFHPTKGANRKTSGATNQEKPVGLSFIQDFFYRVRSFLGSWFGTFDYYVSLTIALANKAIELNPEIVHCNDLDSLWAGYLVKKKTGAKLVFDAHEFWLDMGLSYPKPYVLAFKLSEKYLLGKIDAYVTVNQPILDKTESYYAHEFTVPTEVVYNCPNYEKVDFKKPGAKINILYQGRYARHRGLEQLAEAARYLPDKVELGFRGVKDNVIENDLKNIAKQNKAESKVIIHEEVPMNEMVKFAKKADIGVIPYVPVHLDNELASPNKLFEYMMAGLALACSDLPVLRYFVKKYHNGVLFNPRDPKSIAKALNYLISHPVELAQMKKNSLEAAKEMNWENQQEKLINIYEKILN